ncbi:MAG TPA: hypothetical protein VK158_00010 [Acidobacteriota bacterium]|nr:hypothetical protein [Acidobacteriota bacterium]
MKKKNEDDMRDEMNKVQKKLDAQFAKARAGLQKFELRARKYAQKNPRKAAAIAVGVGAAVGAALSTLWRRKR